MSTDAGSAAAPEDSATRDVASERPGLESGDPESADSATSTPETADRGVEGSADAGGDTDGASEADAEPSDLDAGKPDAGGDGDGDGASEADPQATDSAGDSGLRDSDPINEGFISSLLRDSTITGLPGETGAPPVEPHAPQAQQEGDEPVGSEPPSDDNPDGVD